MVDTCTVLTPSLSAGARSPLAVRLLRTVITGTLDNHIMPRDTNLKRIMTHQPI